MNWLIYGAYGYTGRLLAAEARRRGLSPRLSGRDADALAGLSRELGCPATPCTLDNRAELEALLRDADLVLHCAGPFSHTHRAMLDACLATGTHYLDISGEIDVFRQAWERDPEARQNDVVVCPGVGFDVAATDCLAARLVEELPAATRLVLAFDAGGGPSPGTAKTAAEALGKGGCVRRDGALVTVPIAWKDREIPFAHGVRRAVTIPWGDVFTAWVSTGVPNVEVYVAVSPRALRRLRRFRWLRPLLALGWVRRYAQRRIGQRLAGPDADRRASTRVEVWGEAASADGRRVAGTLSGPNGYDFTVLSALAIVEHLAGTRVEGGYYTPSLLMGSGFAARLAGVDLRVNAGP